MKIENKYKNLSLEAKSSIWYMICNLLQKCIGVITVPILTRLLTTSEYGLYSIFLAWLQLFEIPVTLRLSWGSYIVGLTKFNDDRERYTSSLLSLSFIITTLFLVLYLLFYKYVDKITGLSFELTLLIFAILYTMPVISFWSGLQKVCLWYKQMVIVTIFISLSVPLIGIYFIINDTFSDKYQGMIYSRFIIQGIIAFILALSFYKASYVIYNKKYWKYALSINLPLVPYYYSLVLLAASSKIMIQNMIGNAEAGIYSVAYSAAMVMTLMNSSLNSAIQPWFFKKLKDNNYDGISKILSMSILVVAVINLLLIAFAPEAVAIFAPPQYYEAIWIIPPIAASVVIMFIYQHFVNIEFYFEETKKIAAASIGAAVVNIGLNYLLLPIFGYLIAGYVVLASYLIFAVVHYFMCKKICIENNCPIDLVNLKVVLLILIIFALLAVLLTFGYVVPLIKYIFIFITGVIMYYKRGFLYVMYKGMK